MGFYDEQSNIEALRRSGGNVHAAVEYLLTHPIVPPSQNNNPPQTNNQSGEKKE
jgi:hypothetical protein